MSDPSLSLQKAFFDAIKGLGTSAGANVFDQVGPADIYPRVVIGEGQSIGNFADCYEGTESYLDVHVWSRIPGFIEAKTIASQIRKALHDADLDLDGHTLELLQFRIARFLKDPDGLTSHIALTFRALTQPSS